MSYHCPLPHTPHPRRLTQTQQLTFTQKGQDELPSSSKLEYYVHGWYLRYEGDKGLQFAKWCDVPLLLGVLTKEEINEAVDAYEDTRSGAHDVALAAWEAEQAAREEELAIRASQAATRAAATASAPASAHASAPAAPEQ
jgi:hypothetical protein